MTIMNYLPAYKDSEGNRLVFPFLWYETREEAERCQASRVVQNCMGYEADGIEEVPVGHGDYLVLHHVPRGPADTPIEEAVISGPYLDEHCKCEHH